MNLVDLTVAVADWQAGLVRNGGPRYIRRIGHLVVEVMQQVLHDCEKQEATRRIYNKRRFHEPREMQLWETCWFEQQLPKAPAQILLAGCGTGREVRALVKQGYRIDAFDPAEHLLEEAERIGVSKVRWFVLSCEQLVSLANDDPNHPILSTRYDAVIFGWDALSHVLAHEQRRDTLLMAKRVCPDGPILASYVSFKSRKYHVARGVARVVGRRIGRLRGRSRAPEVGERFWCDTGFITRLRRLDIERLAEQTGLSFGWELAENSGVVTFYPASASAIHHGSPKKQDAFRAFADQHDGEWITCVGSSMLPTVQPGVRVRVRGQKNVRPGDVGLFCYGPDSFVLHRVLFRIPGTQWIAHVGDAGGRPTFAHVSRLIGRADLARRPGPAKAYMAASFRVAQLSCRRMARKLSSYKLRKEGGPK